MSNNKQNKSINHYPISHLHSRSHQNFTQQKFYDHRNKITCNLCMNQDTSFLTFLHNLNLKNTWNCKLQPLTSDSIEQPLFLSPNVQKAASFYFWLKHAKTLPFTQWFLTLKQGNHNPHTRFSERCRQGRQSTSSTLALSVRRWRWQSLWISETFNIPKTQKMSFYGLGMFFCDFILVLFRFYFRIITPKTKTWLIIF